MTMIKAEGFILEQEGTEFTIKFDSSRKIGTTRSGKPSIATSRGALTVADDDGNLIKINLNVYQ